MEQLDQPSTLDKTKAISIKFADPSAPQDLPVPQGDNSGALIQPQGINTFEQAQQLNPVATTHSSDVPLSDLFTPVVPQGNDPSIPQPTAQPQSIDFGTIVPSIFDVAQGLGMDVTKDDVLNAATTTAKFVGPGADVTQMFEDLKNTVLGVKEGDPLKAISSFALSLMAIPMMLIPGSIKSVEEVALLSTQHKAKQLASSKAEALTGINRVKSGEVIPVNLDMAPEVRVAANKHNDAIVAARPENQPTFKLFDMSLTASQRSAIIKKNELINDVKLKEYVNSIETKAIKTPSGALVDITSPSGVSSLTNKLWPKDQSTQREMMELFLLNKPFRNQLLNDNKTIGDLYKRINELSSEIISSGTSLNNLDPVDSNNLLNTMADLSDELFAGAKQRTLVLTKPSSVSVSKSTSFQKDSQRNFRDPFPGEEGGQQLSGPFPFSGERVRHVTTGKGGGGSLTPDELDRILKDTKDSLSDTMLPNSITTPPDLNKIKSDLTEGLSGNVKDNIDTFISGEDFFNTSNKVHLGQSVAEAEGKSAIIDTLGKLTPEVIAELKAMPNNPHSIRLFVEKYVDEIERITDSFRDIPTVTTPETTRHLSNITTIGDVIDGALKNKIPNLPQAAAKHDVGKFATVGELLDFENVPLLKDIDKRILGKIVSDIHTLIGEHIIDKVDLPEEVISAIIGHHGLFSTKNLDLISPDAARSAKFVNFMDVIELKMNPRSYDNEAIKLLTKEERYDKIVMDVLFNSKQTRSLSIETKNPFGSTVLDKNVNRKEFAEMKKILQKPEVRQRIIDGVSDSG